MPGPVGAAPGPIGLPSDAATTLATLRDQLARGQTAGARVLAESADPALGGHPARLLGEAAQASRQYREAIGWYERALAAGLSRSHQANVYERLAQSAEALGDWSAAGRYYQQVGALSRSASSRAEAGYREASARDKAGDRAGAQQVWAATARGYPETRDGARSLEALEALGSDARDLVPAATRGAIYAGQEELQPAVEAYTKAILAAGDPAAAWELFYQRALVRLRQDGPAGQADLREILRSYPTHPRAPGALWHLAQFQQATGDRDLAQTNYLALADRYPASPYADDALVEAGVLFWQNRDVEAAWAAWRRAIAQYPRADSASRAHYWIGKTQAQHAGDAAGVAELQAAAQHDDYYGYRARAALRGEWRPPRSSPLTAERWIEAPRSPERDAEGLIWLAAWTSPGGSTLDLTDDLQRRAEFVRGHALLRAGFTADAGLELGDLADQLADQPAPLFRLGVWLGENGLAGPALSAGRRLNALATRAGVIRRPALLDRLLYPNGYAGLVVRSGADRGVDPGWFFALVRQESAFDPTAKSVAGARGLTQIMPATGAEIARALGRTRFDPANLDQPSLAIDFGIHYLAGGLDRFQGDIMLALAAYNAGPGAVAGWLSADGYHDFDVFVESIPYAETRTYLKTVYVNYYRYRSTYGAD